MIRLKIIALDVAIVFFNACATVAWWGMMLAHRDGRRMLAQLAIVRTQSWFLLRILEAVQAIGIIRDAFRV